MNGKTKKSALMSSWKKKWDNNALKNKIGGIVASNNKKPQLEYLTSQYENLSKNEIEKKMKDMGFSHEERSNLIEENSELSRVFGFVKKGSQPLTKNEKRRLLKKQEMHKKFNIRSGRDDASGNIKNKKKNPLEGIYHKKHGTADEYGYANVEEEGHHDVTALGGRAKDATSISKSSANDSVIPGKGANSLTGGGGGINKGGRPIGL